MFLSIKHPINVKYEIYIILICLILAFIYTFCLNVPYKFLASAFFILYLSRFNRITTYVTATLYTIISLIFPITLNFGVPTKSHFFNLFNSNINESTEFISLIISFDSICIILATFLCLIIYTKTCCKLLTKPQSLECNSTNKKFFHKASSCILVALIIFIGFRCYPTKIFPDSILLFNVALNELDSFNNAVNKPTDIEIIKNDKKIKNVVVIIGESVESDYLSVIGYPHPTTPNLDKFNGHFYKNNISAASYTIASLMRTLSYSPDKQSYELNNNIVNLANKAGFTTYYFSLESDSEKELLNDYFASLSKFNKYNLPKTKSSLDSSNNSKSKNIEWQLLQNRNDDFKLLTLFDIATKDQEEYRMIFLHMIGHHPNVCHRLRSYSNIFKNLKHTIPNNSPDELNCYLSVTHKLDYFITHINNRLTELGEPYYLFYISDHGLLFDLESKLRTFIHHGHTHKSNFRAPLIVLSSEIKTHEIIEDYISSYDFMSNLINYLNIDTNIIKAKGRNELKKTTLDDIDIYVNDKIMKYSEMNDFKIFY